MLTGQTYKSLEPLDGRTEQTFFDAKVKGLALRVFASGKGSWIVQYRPKGVRGDRAKMGTKRAILGDRETMSLSKAREQARATQARIDQGCDPVAERNRLRTEPGDRVGNLIDAYAADLARRSVVNRRTVISTLRRCFQGQLSASLATVRLTGLLGTLDSLEKAGKPGAAADFRKCSSAFFGYCVARGVLQTNPWSSYRRARQSRAESLLDVSHGRVLTDAELKSLWLASVARKDPFGAIVRFLILTGARRKEAAHLRRSWVNDGWITFPAAFTKQARDHSVPVTSGIAKLLCDQSPRGELFWPSTSRSGGGTPISGWSKLVPALRKSSGVVKFTLHDIRRTFRTWAEETYGAADVLCEAAIGHVSSNVLNRIYSRPTWRKDLVELFAAWGRHIEQITEVA